MFRSLSLSLALLAVRDVIFNKPDGHLAETEFDPIAMASE